MRLGLDGRACIVTGASRGIGAAIAAELCAEGARVLLVARGARALEAAAAACGDGASPLALDVTAPGAGDRAVAGCVERFGALDVLVNCAGTSAVRALDALTDAEWEEQWRLSVLAPLALMRAAAPRMAASGWGRIVNVSSTAGRAPATSNAAYSVAKAGQLALSRAFADAYAAQGVVVNAVTPGRTATPLRMAPGGLADQTAAARGIGRAEAIAAAAREIPLGRPGEAQEIAAAAVLLCSERAAGVAGAAWSVDGGMLRALF